MKARLKAFLKHNRFFYLLYYYLGSSLLRLLGLFIPTDPDLFLFISYGGKKYDDSPRVVYEYLLEHPVSPSHRYVWAFTDPDRYTQIPNRIRVDTLGYYCTALRAGYWITNSSACRGLNFQKKATRNILFAHGLTGYKKIGTDHVRADKSFHVPFHQKVDLVFVEGRKEIPILLNAWSHSADVYRATGLPRNDDLAQVSPDEIRRIRERLGLPEGKRVILYAPTFRDNPRGDTGLSTLPIPFDFDKWAQALGNSYVLMITAHYEVARLLDQLPKNDFVYNAFGYPVLNDLLKVADVLISDYSSIIFDYSILERPILCYAYDLDSFLRDRGLYVHPDDLFSQGALRTEDQLLEAIRTMDYDRECRFTRDHIKEEYIASYGNAAERAVAEIFALT